MYAYPRARSYTWRRNSCSSVTWMIYYSSYKHWPITTSTEEGNAITIIVNVTYMFMLLQSMTKYYSWKMIFASVDCIIYHRNRYIFHSYNLLCYDTWIWYERNLNLVKVRKGVIIFRICLTQYNISAVNMHVHGQKQTKMALINMKQHWGIIIIIDKILLNWFSSMLIFRFWRSF